MHPLTPDLSQLKDQDLQKKYSDLMQRLNQAYKFGNADLVYQIQILAEDYKEEMNRRQQKLLDDIQNKSDKFNGVIDIK